MELIVVSRTSEELKAIVQLRCLGLTGTDIYIYIYIYANTKRQRNMITCLALQLGNVMPTCDIGMLNGIHNKKNIICGYVVNSFMVQTEMAGRPTTLMGSWQILNSGTN